MLRSDIALSDSTTGVDREQNVIRGYVVAQEGPFKSQGRGQFTRESLEKVVELGNANERGIRVRFGHPNMSDDGLGKFLGRSKDFRLDESGSILLVRADMYLNETSLDTPPSGGRPLGEYTIALADSDPGAFSSSMVLMADKLYPDEDGPNAEDPPIWFPTMLLASDVVDTGDAVDDFLSADLLEDLPTGEVYAATKLIDAKFDGQPRDIVQARLRAFCDKYLEHKFGVEDELTPAKEIEPMADEQKNDGRIDALENKVDGVIESLGKLADALSADREAAKKREAVEARAKKITALCAQCGVDAKKANEWISDECLTVDDVKDQLLSQKFELNPPAGDSDDNVKQDEESRLSAEYDEYEYEHKMLGVTREQFVEQRKLELAGAKVGEYQMDSFHYIK